MKTIAIAAVLSIAAVLGASATSTRTQAAILPASDIARAKADIAELPLPTATKLAFLARVEGCDQGQAYSLVEEARHAVDIPFGSRVEGRDGHGAIITPDGVRIPLS